MTDVELATFQISTRQALLMPIVASGMLILLFFFFEQVEFVYIVANVVLAGICCEMLVAPVLPSVLPIGAMKHTVRLPFNRKVPLPSLASGLLAAMTVCAWLMTSHWLLLDLLAAGLSVFMIATVRVPSAKLAAVIFVVS